MSVELIRIPFNERYISDGIKKDYVNWKAIEPLRSSTKVFIDSPTGTGKTSFIINELLPFAAKYNRNILYIGNRVAIKEQTENVLQNNEPKLIYLPNKNGASTYLYPGTYSHITLLNYQSALSFESDLLYYYVIFDEVHFFVEDALFNQKTYEIFDELLSRYMYSVNVFMSATMTEFATVYGKSFREYMPTHSEQEEIHKAVYHWEVKYYENSYSRPSYNAVLYEHDDYLLDAIRKSPSEDKWIVFEPSIHRGNLLKNRIKDKTNKKCKLISSKSEHTVAWKKLLEKGQFDENILITTKVLDNGINLTDKRIKHIVLPFCERTEFIQMIGRRRFTSDDINADGNLEIVNLYIRQPTIQEVNNNIKTYKKQNKEIARVSNGILKSKREKDDTIIKKLIRKYWNNCDPTINKLFYIKVLDGNIKFIVNPLAAQKISVLLLTYETISKNYKNPYLYSDIIQLWLGNSLFRISKEGVPVYQEKLIDFLDKHIGCQITDTETFYNNFLTHYKIYCDKMMKDNGLNEQWLDKMFSVRKGTTRRKSTINQSLQRIQLNYIVKKKNNCWTIEKIPQ